MNYITLIGRLTKDPELRKTTTGKSLATTTIAVDKPTRNEDGERETNFFDLKFFEKRAETATKYMRKGDKVCVVGRLDIREYVNKDSVKMKAIEVVVGDFELLEPKKKETEANDGNKAVEDGSNNLDSLDLPDDDLPF